MYDFENLFISCVCVYMYECAYGSQKITCQELVPGDRTQAIRLRGSFAHWATLQAHTFFWVKSFTLWFNCKYLFIYEFFSSKITQRLLLLSLLMGFTCLALEMSLCSTVWHWDNRRGCCLGFVSTYVSFTGLLVSWISACKEIASTKSSFWKGYLLTRLPSVL